MDGSQISFASRGLEDLAVAHQVDVNPLTGAAVVSVPLALTPGRAGFGPSLALQYSSSGGNSVYGVGWSLAGLSSIGLTSKQHPKYDGKDRFVFNGTEELVLAYPGEGESWPTDRGEYRVRHYRSKAEQSYTRFEQWVHRPSGRMHWLSRDRDGVVSIYGLNADDESRIADPKAPERTYLWLVEAQYDGRGNAIHYEYAKENTDNLDLTQAAERNRVRSLNGGTFPQRYLKRIRYGNTRPLNEDQTSQPDNDWLFEVVFDYGDEPEDPRDPPPEIQTWQVREDPYSSRRPGFEIRTYRLCRRVLMFHHFEELGPGPTLIGSTQFTHNPDTAGTTLTSISYTGFRRDTEAGKPIPPLKFEYAAPTVEQSFQAAPEQTRVNFPYGLVDARYRWIDLYGEGLPGILTETNQAWYYKPNLGGGNFGDQQKVAIKPSQRVGSYALSDFDRDGNLDLVVIEGRQAGYCAFDRHTGQWQGFRPFNHAPHVDTLGSRAQWLDLNGDGLADLLISRQDRFTWYPSEGREGFGSPVELAKPRAAAQAQTITEDLDLELFFADMTGDGLLDQVRIQNGRVEYWPQLGRGHFGDSVVMEGAPRFDYDTEFDPSRLHLVDLDGSGTTDLLYIGRGEIRYWINACGNGFGEAQRLAGLPYIDDLSTVRVLDFLGNGTPCLVWSSPLASFAEAPLHYLRLSLGDPNAPGLQLPRLLRKIDNSMGQETELVYASSSSHYLRDKTSGRGWISKLPSHSTVVDRKEVRDLIGGSRLVSRYEYHDGHFDGKEREFRGFGLVDQFDSEPFASTTVPEAHYTQPACVRTWHHNGAFGWDDWRALDYYSGDPEQPLLPAPVFEELMPLGQNDFEEAYRALAGQVIRREVYAVSAQGQRAEHPYQVNQTAYRLQRLQPSIGDQDPCFTFYPSESLSIDYEQEPQDPRVAHNLTLEVDRYGNACQTCTVGYPRRSTTDDVMEAQQNTLVSASQQTFVNIDLDERYELGIPDESQEFELAALNSESGNLFRYDDLKDRLAIAIAARREFHEELDNNADEPEARLVGWDRSYYWNADATVAVRPSEITDAAQLYNPILPHHQESACFNQPFIDEVFTHRVDADRLSNESGYLLADGYWWQPSPIAHYETSEGFFNLAREERQDGGTTDYTYDLSYCLTLTDVVDAMGNRTEAQIDYHLIAPHHITDPNENVAEVRYDPLGMILVSTSHGSVLAYDWDNDREREGSMPYGNAPLSEYTVQSNPEWGAILAEPERFIQHASQFFYYELDSWELHQQPLRSISLVREEVLHDGHGNEVPESRIQTILTYLDGFGRTLQSKQRVEPGLAITRDASGRVLFEPNGLPVETHTDERWLVSGHTVYNNKQQPVRQYEPFFSPSAEFEPDEELETYGVSGLYSYDALGRQIRQVFPNQTLTRTEATAWEVLSYDPNDTVEDEDCLYRIYIESNLPADAPERRALNKARAHAGTPTITRLDPLGREIAQVETANDSEPRITESQLDSQGNVTDIIDPRGLTAFIYRHDMLGRVLNEHSIDAGDTWTLPDVQDRTIHQWDRRDVHQHFTYDRLGRPTSVYVEGTLVSADVDVDDVVLDQTTERLFYGDDPPLDHAGLRNARGRLVEHYDQAGRMAVRQYTPDGAPLRTERQLMRLNSETRYDAEPDWTSAAPTWSDLYSEPLDLDPTVYRTLTALDALGRVREQRLPDQTIRSFTYLQSGGVTGVGVTTSDGYYNDEAFLEQAIYNARGQRTLAQLGNGAETTYEYDRETFRLKRLTTTRVETDANGNPVTRSYQDIEYTYDPAGNITRQLDHAQEPDGVREDVLQGLTVSPVCDYTYDAFYQLTEATGRVHQLLEQHDRHSGFKGTQHLNLNNTAAVERYLRTYDYDLGGNIETIRHYRLATDGDTSLNWTQPIWISGTSNRSLPAHDLNRNPISSPEGCFDANGNCTLMPHLRAMAWNYRNNLARAVFVLREDDHSNDAEYYVYGADGMRIRKVWERIVTLGETFEQDLIEVTEKIYLDGCEIKRVRRNGVVLLTQLTSHISDSVNRIALLHQWPDDDASPNKIHFQFSNHLGSASLELDGEEEQVISYEEYFPFGGTAFIAGREPNVRLKEYRYSGKERDDSTGFYYYGYRYYAPWIGNWLSPDPIGPDDSVNLYQFVLNNPVNLVDPNGLTSLDEMISTLPPEVLERIPLDVLEGCAESAGCTIAGYVSEAGEINVEVRYHTGEQRESTPSEAAMTAIPLPVRTTEECILSETCMLIEPNTTSEPEMLPEPETPIEQETSSEPQRSLETTPPEIESPLKPLEAREPEGRRSPLVPPERETKPAGVPPRSMLSGASPDFSPIV